MLDLTVRTERDIRIVELAGELNSVTAQDAYDRLQPQLEDAERVIIHMKDVRYMSSAGIRVLLLLYRLVLNNGGKIVLAALSEELQEMLDVTGFLEYFNIQNSLQSSLDLFA